MDVRIPIKDIKKIAIVQTDCTMTLEQVIMKYGCTYAINGGLYNTTTHKPNCWLKVDGKLIKSEKDGYWCYGWNEGPDIKMIHSSQISTVKNAIACCSLVKDGSKTILLYDKKGQGGTRGRTAIGIDRQDNLVLFVSKDGTPQAMTPEKLQPFMISQYACASAIMLDSGGSSQGWFNGKRYGGTRKVANWILIWTNDVSVKNPYPVPTATLRKGNRGDTVKWLQCELDSAGYNIGKYGVDGIFGKDTKAAVENYQRDHKLEDDGIVGPMTRGSLIK